MRVDRHDGPAVAPVITELAVATGAVEPGEASGILRTVGQSSHLLQVAATRHSGVSPASSPASSPDISPTISTAVTPVIGDSGCDGARRAC